MKFCGLLLLAVIAAAVVEGGQKCVLDQGVHLYMFSGNSLKMKLPCKYNMIKSRCGDYRITVTPGNRFLRRAYIIDTVWVSVNRTDGVFWSGRTTTKVAAKFIIGKVKTGFNQKSDNTTTTTEDLFEESTSTESITLLERNRTFRLTFAPFHFSGNFQRDNKLEFQCNSDDMEDVPYPQQICGNSDKSIVNKRAEEKFGKNSNKDLLVILDVFNDTSIVQTDPKCQEATNLMTNKCEDETWQKNATRTCHLLLDSDRHRSCALKYTCDPMDAFNACLDYVCGKFDKHSSSCEAIGMAIDLCRNFPGLTDPVKKANCFKDFFTEEDMPSSND